MSGSITRSCARCGKPLSKDRAKARKKYCHNDEQAVKRAQREAAHRRRVASLYGLQPGDYEAIYEFQNKRCAICLRATGVTKRLAVDHDHRIGSVRHAVRGLLCSKCNGMLGYARDDPAMFERAAEYLRNPPAQQVLVLGDVIKC